MRLLWYIHAFCKEGWNRFYPTLTICTPDQEPQDLFSEGRRGVVQGCPGRCREQAAVSPNVLSKDLQAERTKWSAHS